MRCQEEENRKAEEESRKAEEEEKKQKEKEKAGIHRNDPRRAPKMLASQATVKPKSSSSDSSSTKEASRYARFKHYTQYDLLE